MTHLTEDTLSLEISRHFAATPERVFSAWLGKEWGAWLPPGGSTCQVTAIDPVEGGRYEVSMTMPDGRKIHVTGAYREIDFSRRLVLTWVGDYDNRETLITVTFKPEHGGTLMTLRQEGFIASELRDGYDKGWTGAGGSFDKLQVMLAA